MAINFKYNHINKILYNFFFHSFDSESNSSQMHNNGINKKKIFKFTTASKIVEIYLFVYAHF
jgi:hypothetical protein